MAQPPLASPLPHVLQPTPAPVQDPLKQLLDEKENDKAIQRVYLITMARVLATSLSNGRVYKDLSTLSRADVGNATISSFNILLPAGISGGAPQQGCDRVLLVVVFREQHSDGSIHFHVVVKLAQNARFKSAKRTLREQFLLPSHFSCSHTLLWSAIRYGHIETEAKPVVDGVHQ